MLLDGTDLSKLNDKALTILRRNKIGFVFQFFNLIPVLSALENVALPLVLDGTQGRRERERRTWLKRVGLARPHGPPAERVVGRAAAAGGPGPRAGYRARRDPGRRADRQPGLARRRGDAGWLRRTVDEWGRTVVMVTHDPRMAAYADRIIFMKDGTVVDDTRLDADKGAEYLFEKMETIVGR